MDSRQFRPQVPPTLAYLEEIVRNGHRITDVFLTGMLPTMHEMKVYLEGEKVLVYYIEGDTATIMDHYRKAIEFSGYGPRGLGNLIHADVMQRCRQTGHKQEDFEVLVSRECLNRIQAHATQWTYYGYKILVSPSLAGLAFTVRDRSGGLET